MSLHALAGQLFYMMWLPRVRNDLKQLQIKGDTCGNKRARINALINKAVVRDADGRLSVVPERSEELKTKIEHNHRKYRDAHMKGTCV